jgi:hypothetical protein
LSVDNFILKEEKVVETGNLQEQFRKMGAELKFEPISRFSRMNLEIDVEVSKKKEVFVLRTRKDVDVELVIVNISPEQRHLLLQAIVGKDKFKYLCGHDERHWFSSAVPRDSKDVFTAMEGLKPPPVREAQDGRVKTSDLKKHNKRRKNEAYIRQGEWFFIPSGIIPDSKLILRNEPITNGRRGSKQHICEELYRTGGENVYVHGSRIISANMYNTIPDKDKQFYRLMRRNATVYVRGHIRHADHKTVYLPGWCEVHLNTERTAPGARAVTFLD